MRVAVDSNQQIVITLESEFEADIMAACLNWGFSAMKRTGLLACDDSAEDDAKGKTETAMWASFKAVYTGSQKEVEHE